MSDDKKCLTCDRVAFVRGLCVRCHRTAMRALKNGADEQELIDANLILPPKQGGRAQSPWTIAAAELKNSEAGGDDD